jgi:predicted acetyltransferase
VGIELRAPADERELRLAVDVTHRALVAPALTDAEWDVTRDGLDLARSVTAWDDGVCVGHAHALALEMTVPGSSLPVAALSWVGVAPTHTRRGIVTSIMAEVLRSARSRGDVLSSLGASEAAIYGRFGFGIASHRAEVKIDLTTSSIDAPDVRSSMRLLDRDELLEVLPPLYDRLRRERPASITRTRQLWLYYLEDLLGPEPQKRWVYVHVAADGGFDGFVDVEVERVKANGGPSSHTGKIVDLWAATPELSASLWRFVSAIDRVGVIEREECPLDDPVRWRLSNPRALSTTAIVDEQWLRMLDVDACLRARCYGSGESVVVEVTDPVFEDNCGRWRVSGDGVERTEVAADVACDVRAVSAAYLGGVAVSTLAAAGHVRGTSDALARADRLFAHHPLPFCGSMY